MQKCDIENMKKNQGIINDDLNGQFKLFKLLGSGTFGSVYSAHDIINKKHVAIKFMKKDPRNIILCQYLDKEVEHLQSLRKSRYVVTLHCSVKSVNMIILIMEELQTDLGKVLKDFGKLSEDICEIILQQMFNALFELRQLQIIHRDIKPQNIGINLSLQQLKDYDQRTVELQCKLLDFGLSKTLRDQETANSLVGTRHYWAPEVQNEDSYSYEVDIYSLGVTMLQLITGISPNDQEFASEDNFNKIEKRELRKYIQSMMDIKAAKRPNWEDITNHHHYFSQNDISTGIDNLQNMPEKAIPLIDINKLKLERQRYILLKNTAVKLQELIRDLHNTQFYYLQLNSQIHKYIVYLMRNARMFNEQLSQAIVTDQSQQVNQLRQKINKEFRLWFKNFKEIKEKPNAYLEKIRKLLQSELHCVHIHNPEFQIQFYKTNQANYTFIQHIINHIGFKDKNYTPEQKLASMNLVKCLTNVLIYLAFCKGSIENMQTVQLLEAQFHDQTDPFSALTGILVHLNITYN